MFDKCLIARGDELRGLAGGHGLLFRMEYQIWVARVRQAAGVDGFIMREPVMLNRGIEKRDYRALARGGTMYGDSVEDSEELRTVNEPRELCPKVLSRGEHSASAAQDGGTAAASISREAKDGVIFLRASFGKVQPILREAADALFFVRCSF